MELDELQNQIKQLRLKGKKLQYRMTTEKCKTTSMLKEYAQVDCRKLCDAVYRSLPREVRDMIYENIHLEQQMIVDNVSCEYDWATSEPVVYTYFESKSDSLWRLGSRHGHEEEHWWKAEAVGEGMLQELLQTYYGSMQFDFRSRFDLISRFQTTDQWEVGFLPVDFATNVAVAITCNDSTFDIVKPREYAKAEINSWCWGGRSNKQDECTCSSHEPEKMLHAKILQDLQALFGFKHGTKISIDVSVIGRDKSVQGAFTVMRETFIPAIFCTLQRLRDNGYKVSINLSVSTWPPVSRKIHIPVDDSTPNIAAWKDEFRKVSELLPCPELNRGTNEYSSR
jgi:hypothetical protein